MPIFDNYSKYYNLLYQDKDYSKESDYIQSLLQKFVPQAKKILELGCGTGKHAKLLNKKGYEVFGIDLSQKMINQAKSLDVNCSIGDVRSFRVKQKFDAVLSLFHVASYQTSNKDISDFFETASYHLTPKGILIFDVWYKDAVLAQLPEKRIKKLENDEIEVTRYCIPEHIQEQSLVKVHYKIEITDKKSNQKEIIEECHPMRYFSKEEIDSLAELFGISIIAQEEWLTGKNPDKSTWGVCFIGRKK